MVPQSKFNRTMEHRLSVILTKYHLHNIKLCASIVARDYCARLRACLIVVITLLISVGCLLSLFRLIAKTTITMGPSRTNSTSTQNPANKDEDSNLLVECSRPGADGSGCVFWTNIWVPTLIPKKRL